MSNHQTGIIAEVPGASRHLFFQLRHGADAGAALDCVGALSIDDTLVVGIGKSLVDAAGGAVAGLADFPRINNAGIDIPSNGRSLWAWLRGNDTGEVFHAGRRLTDALAEHFELADVIDCFMHRDSRDLSGYVDGTENPEDEDAPAAAFAPAGGDAPAGSSFVAVQQWLHDFDSLDAMGEGGRDSTIGRRISDNEEIEEAPETAHVKRTAQEDYDPEAFVLRRSMPWVEGEHAGLVFVAFGKSFYAFDALLKRMTGLEDGETDALFSFTRPLSGYYFWCPPTKGERLDLSGV